MSAAGTNKVSYPNIADLKYSNTLDLFKVLQIPRLNFNKTGQVSTELDHVIKKSVVYARGPVSSANRFLVPGKINQQFCLPQRYMFIQMSPDISFHTEKNIFTQTHTSITLQTQSISGQTVRFQLTTLTNIPKVSASSVVLPLRLQRWSTIVIDFQQLYKLAFNGTFTYRGFLQFEATATCVVKGVYMSNLKYSPFDQVEILRLQAPQGYRGADISNLVEHYDWIEYGIRQFDQIKRQNLQFVSQRDIFSQNISHGMPYLCDISDFEQEMLEYQQKEQQKSEIKNQSRNRPTNTQSNRLNQTLSTYKAALVKKSQFPVQIDVQEENFIDRIEVEQIQTDFQAAKPVEEEVKEVEQEIINEIVDQKLSEQQILPQSINFDIVEEQLQTDHSKSNLITYSSQSIKKVPTSKKVKAVEETKNDVIDDIDLGIIQELSDDLPSQIIEQMIIEQTQDNQKPITTSELYELKTAFQQGKQHLDDNFQELNQTATTIKIVKNDFVKVFKEKIQQLHSLFIPQIQLNTVQSALNIRGIIGCEVTSRFQLQNQESLEILEPNLETISTLDPRESMIQSINWVNYFVGGKILYADEQDIKVNQTEVPWNKPIIVPNTYLTLLLNHHICASIVIPQKEIQLFISHDFVINQLLKVQFAQQKSSQLYKDIDLFVQQSIRSNIQLLAAANNQHFIVIFQHYGAIFELTEKNTIAIRAVFNNRSTDIHKFELARFSNINNKLVLIGTNLAQSSIQIAIFSLENVISLGNGWLNNTQDKFVILKNPLKLEQLSNQQRHERVTSLIEINPEQYLILTNQNLRHLRLKDGITLRMSAITLDFSKYKKQLIKLLQNTLLYENKQFISLKSPPQNFEENVNSLITLFINSTGLTHIGIVPNTQNKLYLILSNIAIIQLKLSDLLQNTTPDIDGFLPHGFVPILSTATSSNNFILTSDIAGNIFCHREICGQQNMSAKFNQPVIAIDSVKFTSKSENFTESSQLFNKSNSISLSTPNDEISQFVSFQNSGELAVFEIGENGAQEYRKYYNTTVYDVHDFAFDPNHYDEMMILTACDANVVNVDKIYERKIQYSINVNGRYQNIKQIKYKNLIRYHPSSYVTAIYYPEEQEFILTDLNNSDMLFCSKKLFQGISQCYNIEFTQNGNYFLISSSEYGLKIYSIENQIKQVKHVNNNLLVFKTAQILNKTSKKQTEVIVGINPQHQVVLASIDNLLNDQGFRVLNSQKQTMEFVMDKKSKQKFVSEESLDSAFYAGQISYLRNILQAGIIQRSPSNHGLIQLTNLNVDMDINNFKFIERRVLEIQVSQCIPNLLGAIVSDTFIVSSISPQSKQNYYITAYSLETFALSNGKSLQSFHFSTTVSNELTYSSPILIQSRIHGTYCAFLPFSQLDQTFVYSLNLLTPSTCMQFRISLLPYVVSKAKISQNEDKIALSSQNSSLFIFDWNCTDFCYSEEDMEEQKIELQKAILELRLEKIVVESGICEYGSQNSMSGTIKSGIVII